MGFGRRSGLHPLADPALDHPPAMRPACDPPLDELVRAPHPIDADGVHLQRPRGGLERAGGNGGGQGKARSSAAFLSFTAISLLRLHLSHRGLDAVARALVCSGLTRPWPAGPTRSIVWMSRSCFCATCISHSVHW